MGCIISSLVLVAVAASAEWVRRRRLERAGWFYTSRCTRCGYDLRNLPGDRCPECGQFIW